MADWQRLAGAGRGAGWWEGPMSTSSVRAAYIHILNYTVLAPARLLVCTLNLRAEGKPPLGDHGPCSCQD